jgi:diguanylate cyclase (GGDEF)-like protein
LIRVGGRSPLHGARVRAEQAVRRPGLDSSEQANFTGSGPIDALTGLRNHGTFQRDVEALVEAGDPFSLVMMDLDFFKAFNDTYGHPAGDALLQTVAGAVVAGIRQNDRAYRYGGDEFALLLMGASRSQAE